MTDEYTEYRRERRQRNVPPNKRRSYASRFVRQAVWSAIIFCAIFALKGSKLAISEKTVGFIKNAVEYKVDISKISTVIGNVTAYFSDIGSADK